MQSPQKYVYYTCIINQFGFFLSSAFKKKRTVMRKKKYQSFLFYSITRHFDDRLKCVVHSNEKFCSVKTVRIHLLGELRRPYAS